MSKKKTLQDTARDTSQYIVNIIDKTDWQAILEAHKYCAQCPARNGPQLIDDEIYNLCSACPLKPLMYDIADLYYRQKRENKTPDIK